MTWFEIVSLIGAVISIFGTATASVLWFLFRRTISMVDRLEAKLEAIDKEIDRHKLFSMQTFAKDADVKASLRDLQGSIYTMQNALNTNTNMTGVIMEKITSISERMKN